MTTDQASLRHEAEDFAWLLTRFAQDTAGVVDAITVSSDGLLMAVARTSDRSSSDHCLAAGIR